MSKRIVFTVTNDLTHDRRMHRICSALQQAGYDVTLVGRQKNHSKTLKECEFRQIRLRCITPGGFLFYAEFNIRLMFFLLKHRADIFGAIDLDTILPVVLAAKFRGNQTTYDAHEYFTEVPEVERRPVVRRVWGLIAKWAIPKCNICYTIGDELAAILGQKYHATFSVVRNVPEMNPRTILPPDKRANRLVYIGTLNEGRGLEYAIDAMEQLTDFTLQLIGEGDLSDQLRRKAQKSPAANRIIFSGWVQPEELTELISSSMLALNVLESRSLSYYYSLSNKFFDYIHAGVPSISMAFPEYLSILSSYPVGIAIDTLTSDNIARAVMSVISDNTSYREMLDACETARKVLNWETEKQRLIQLYGTT